MTNTMFIDEENNFLVRRLVGHISPDDIITAHAHTTTHPHFKIGMDIIWDLTQADVGHLSALDLKALSRMIQKQQDWRGIHYKLAIVAPKEIDFIVSSTFSIIGEIEDIPIAVQIFRNFKKAVNWIVSSKYCSDRPRHRYSGAPGTD